MGDEAEDEIGRAITNDDRSEDLDDEWLGDECGRWFNGRLARWRDCMLAGTEFCDLECPLRNLPGRHIDAMPEAHHG